MLFGKYADYIKNGLICPYCVVFLKEEKDATLLSGLLTFMITGPLLRK